MSAALRPEEPDPTAPELRGKPAAPRARSNPPEIVGRKIADMRARRGRTCA